MKLRLGTRPYILHHPVALEHRLLHIAAFAITALLFLFPADRAKEQARAVVGAMLLGCGIELLQFTLGFAPVFEWWDLRDDALGIIGALAVFQAFRWKLGSGVN